MLEPISGIDTESEMNASSKAILRGLRALGTIEGISFLILMGFAMPMKYIWGQPIYVKVFGWAHGILFMALGLQALVAWRTRAIDFMTTFWVMVAALLPAGPFFMDRRLRAVESSAEAREV